MANRRVVLHDDARRELLDAAAYLEGERPWYGTLFFDAFDTAVERLLLYPRAGRRIGRSVRRWVLRGWSYSILYSIEDYGINIVAVAHQSRRSRYWRGRAPS
jgi:plasmid stabilization system protein ParE